MENKRDQVKNCFNKHNRKENIGTRAKILVSGNDDLILLRGELISRSGSSVNMPS